MNLKKTFFAALAAFALLFSGCGGNASAAPRFTAEDFYLTIGGAEYRTGMDIDTVISRMGTAYEYAEAKSCDYDGLDKTFLFEAAEFYTYPTQEGDVVNEIYSASPAVSTSKGLAVGSTKEEVLDGYGGNCRDTGGQLVYTLPDAQGALCFEMESDVVTAVFVTVRPQ